MSSAFWFVIGLLTGGTMGVIIMCLMIIQDKDRRL